MRQLARILHEQHITSGTAEKGFQYSRRIGRAILAEDALVRHTAGKLNTSDTCDIAENLIKTGVVRGDCEFAIREGDLGVVR